MTIEEILKEALKAGVLTIKDLDNNEIVTATSWQDVTAILSEKKVEMTRVLWPKSSKLKSRYVRQFHVRGRTLHEDFRFQLGDGRVWGFTITMPFGVSEELWNEVMDQINSIAKKEIGEVPKDWWKLSDAQLDRIRRKIPDSLRKKFEDEFHDKWAKDYLDWQNKHICMAKAIQDESWLNIEWAKFMPNHIGTTKNKWGFMMAFDRGTIEFGAQKPDHHEFFLKSDRGHYTGRIVFIWLPARQEIRTLQGEEGTVIRNPWVGYMFTAREQKPYVMTHRCLESGFVPPRGISCLPKSIEKLVPKELRYWEAAKPAKVFAEFNKWASKEFKCYERKNPGDIPHSLDLCKHKGG